MWEGLPEAINRPVEGIYPFGYRSEILRGISPRWSRPHWWEVCRYLRAGPHSRLVARVWLNGLGRDDEVRFWVCHGRFEKYASEYEITDARFGAAGGGDTWPGGKSRGDWFATRDGEEARWWPDANGMFDRLGPRGLWPARAGDFARLMGWCDLWIARTVDLYPGFTED